jgi:rhodanese-related sulfurtransferase/peroxiredoxin
MRRLHWFRSHATLMLLLMGALLALATASELSGAEAANDQEFVAWYNATMQQVETAANGMATGIENFDCTTVEAWASTGYEDATKALAELEGYTVSSELQPGKQHLSLALEQYTSACNYTKIGAMQYDADNLEKAAEYVGEAIDHFEEVDALGLVPPTPVVALNRLKGDLEFAAQTVRGTQKPGASPTPTPKSPNISVDEAHKMLQETPDEIILVDTRTEQIYASEHIPGAINIPLSVNTTPFEQEIEKLDKSKIIIAYCQAGRASLVAGDLLVQHGFERVYTMEGGINAWKQKYPTTLTSPQPTAAVSGAIKAEPFTLTSVDGTTFSLSDYSGKVVVLTLILTTCHLCQEEMGELKALKEAYPDIVVISVSIDPLDTDENLRNFKEHYSADWLFARDTARVAARYQGYVLATPTVVVITPKGYISYRKVALVPLEELKTAVALAYEEKGDLMPSAAPADGGLMPGFEALPALLSAGILLVMLRLLGKREAR